RKLVAEVAGGCVSHPRISQMFAQQRSRLLVILIQRHYSIDVLSTRQIADTLDDVVSRVAIGHIENFVDCFARPVCVAEFLDRYEQDAAALILALSKESLALFIAGQAQHR